MTNKTKSAAQICAASKDSIDAINCSLSAGAEPDQDWENETSYYRFEDGSVLVVTGSHFWAVVS